MNYQCVPKSHTLAWLNYHHDSKIISGDENSQNDIVEFTHDMNAEMLKQYDVIGAMKCTICGQFGHISTYCWYQSAVGLAKKDLNNYDISMSEKKCWLAKGRCEKRAQINLQYDTAISKQKLAAKHRLELAQLRASYKR